MIDTKNSKSIYCDNGNQHKLGGTDTQPLNNSITYKPNCVIDTHVISNYYWWTKSVNYKPKIYYNYDIKHYDYENQKLGCFIGKFDGFKFTDAFFVAKNLVEFGTFDKNLCLIEGTRILSNGEKETGVFDNTPEPKKILNRTIYYNDYIEETKSNEKVNVSQNNNSDILSFLLNEQKKNSFGQAPDFSQFFGGQNNNNSSKKSDDDVLTPEKLKNLKSSIFSKMANQSEKLNDDKQDVDDKIHSFKKEFGEKKENQNVDVRINSLKNILGQKKEESVNENANDRVASLKNILGQKKEESVNENANPINIRYIPKDLLSEEMCVRAWHMYANAIEHVPDKFKESKICSLNLNDNKDKEIKSASNDLNNKEKEDDENECVICFENKKDAVFLECRHLCACFECAQSCKECPICRKAGKVIKIYNS